jgi:hypothetical protein
MIPLPSKKSLREAAKADIKRFLDSDRNAVDICRLLAAGKNYFPVYRPLTGERNGVLESQLLEIMRELGVTGDYDMIIPHAQAKERVQGGM